MLPKKLKGTVLIVDLKLPRYIWALPILPAMIFPTGGYGLWGFLTSFVAFFIIHLIFVLTVKTIVETALEFYIQRMETGEDETESGAIYRRKAVLVEETQMQKDESNEKDSV